MAKQTKQTDDAEQTPPQPLADEPDSGDEPEPDPLGTTQPVGADEGDEWHPSDHDEAPAEDQD